MRNGPDLTWCRVGTSDGPGSLRVAQPRAQQGSITMSHDGLIAGGLPIGWVQVRWVKLELPRVEWKGQESGRPRRRFRALLTWIAFSVDRHTAFQFDSGDSPHGR